MTDRELIADAWLEDGTTLDMLDEQELRMVYETADAVLAALVGEGEVVIDGHRVKLHSFVPSPTAGGMAQ